MGYSRTSYGPGDIAALTSGIGLTMGPTIGSNDPRVPLSGMGVDLQSNSACSPGQHSIRMGGKGQGLISYCVADNPPCSMYNCDAGRTKEAFSRTGTDAIQQSSAMAREYLDRGCVYAPCTQEGPSMTGCARTGTCVMTRTFCCPTGTSTPASTQPTTVIPSLPAPPPPPSIVYSTPQVQQTAPQGHGPLFWLGLGAVGIGLFLVLRGGKK
jgi:hypothetical protein